MVLKKDNPAKAAKGEKSVCKGLGFCSISGDANSSVIEGQTAALRLEI